MVDTFDPEKIFFVGSSHSFEGGASIWGRKGKLIGIQVGVGEELYTKDDNGQGSSASGGHCCIVSMWKIEENIQDLLAPIPDDGDDVHSNYDDEDDNDDEDNDNDDHGDNDNYEDNN
uniref:TLDc domain-containing protein n=1 Tax=Caenorhabditis tropicalis TaxID=1561998 RepID=A0A1I7TJ15_9PELO